MKKNAYPHRGEIWYFKPGITVGSEIKKNRPAVVVNEEFMGRFNLNIIVPIIGWKNNFEEFPWMILLRPTKNNGLKKNSGADASQVKLISVSRFDKKIGIITTDELQEITEAIALCIGFECPYCRLN